MNLPSFGFSWNPLLFLVFLGSPLHVPWVSLGMPPLESDNWVPLGQAMMPMMCNQADLLVAALKRHVGYGNATYIDVRHAPIEISGGGWVSVFRVPRLSMTL